MEVSTEGKLSTEKAAKKIGVSPASVHNWAVQGKLPYIKDGRANFFDEETCETVKGLIAEHGTKWHQHSEFTNEDSPAAAKTKKQKNKKTKKQILKRKKFQTSLKNPTRKKLLISGTSFTPAGDSKNRPLHLQLLSTESTGARSYCESI